MGESIHILKQAVEAAKVGDKEKTRALQRLRIFVPLDAKKLLSREHAEAIPRKRK